MGCQTGKFLFSFFLFCFVLPFPYAEKSQEVTLNKTLIEKIKKQGKALISDRIGKYILRAEALADNEKYDQAIDLLEYHYEKESSSKTEKAYLAMQIGQLYKRNKNNNKSLSYLQKALDLKALPYAQHLSSLYNVSQIHVEQEKYDKALKLLKLWFSINENPSPQSYILLAHCYYAKNQLDTALKYVEKTLSLMGRPKESWLQFAVALYLKKENYKKAEVYLERLVALYPSNSSHWKQLAGVYLYLNKNKHAFVTLDMADKMGHLKNKSEYLNLSALYMEQGLPYQGAKLFKEKINQNLIPKDQKNFEILAEAFWMAREEDSALLYLKEASKTAKKPLFFIKYGQRLLDKEKWQEAEKAFQSALKTKDTQKTIKNVQEYKKKLALVNREKNKEFLPALYSQNNKNQKNSLFKKTNGKTAQAKDSVVQKVKKTDTQKTDLALLKAPPTNRLENIYLGIGISLYQRKKYKEALPYFRKSIEVNDTFLSGYQWIDYTENSLLEKQKKELAKKRVVYQSGLNFEVCENAKEQGLKALPLTFYHIENT